MTPNKRNIKTFARSVVTPIVVVTCKARFGSFCRHRPMSAKQAEGLMVQRT